MIDPVFPVHLGESEERGIALTLAKVCHFVHPQIVEAIQQISEEDADRLAEITPNYSVAKGGKLVAYRWDGESVLSADKFYWVNDV